MPYIEQPDRDTHVQDLEFLKLQLRSLSLPDRARAGANLIMNLLKHVYGDTPRYFQHNEAIGMLRCCSLEWQRRKGVEAYIVDTPLIDEGAALELTEARQAIKNVGDRISQLPEETRAGNLNYFITVFLQNLLSAALDEMNKDLPVNILEAVLEEWYRTLTAGYEDKKIQENGDV